MSKESPKKSMADVVYWRQLIKPFMAYLDYTIRRDAMIREYLASAAPPFKKRSQR